MTPRQEELVKQFEDLWDCGYIDFSFSYDEDTVARFAAVLEQIVNSGR